MICLHLFPLFLLYLFCGDEFIALEIISVDVDGSMVLTLLKTVSQNCTFLKRSLSSLLSFFVGNGC